MSVGAVHDTVADVGPPLVVIPDTDPGVVDGVTAEVVAALESPSLFVATIEKV